jgi:hypothetical protein
MRGQRRYSTLSRFLKRVESPTATFVKKGMNMKRYTMAVTLALLLLFSAGCGRGIQTTRTRGVHKTILQQRFKQNVYIERDGYAIRLQSRFLGEPQIIWREFPSIKATHRRLAGGWFEVRLNKGDTIKDEMDHHGFGGYTIQNIQSDGVVILYKSGFNAISFGDGITIDTGEFFLPWRPLPPGGYAQADREHITNLVENIVVVLGRLISTDCPRNTRNALSQYCTTRDTFDVLAEKITDRRKIHGLYKTVADLCFRQMQDMLYSTQQPPWPNPRDYSKLPTVFQSKEAFLKWWPENKTRNLTLSELAKTG